jgi:predicted DsbA family dithiol-disulfide isomerase
MHDRIRNDPDDLQRPALLAHAEALGLDLGLFQSDLDDAAFEEVLRDDWERARECGVHRLPTFVVDGRLVPEGKETASVRTFIAAGLRGRPPPDPSH